MSDCKGDETQRLRRAESLDSSCNPPRSLARGDPAATKVAFFGGRKKKPQKGWEVDEDPRLSRSARTESLYSSRPFFIARLLFIHGRVAHTLPRVPYIDRLSGYVCPPRQPRLYFLRGFFQGFAISVAGGVEMKLKQLESCLGDVTQFSDPKVRKTSQTLNPKP